MTIILDAMGTDTYPDPEILGAVEVAQKDNLEIILVGREDVLRPKLIEAGGDSLPIRIVHAPDILEMTDKPVVATRKKPNNSMSVGLGLVKSGDGEAFVTMGNSGAAMFNASKVLRIRGIRPALALPLPAKNGRFIFLDTGANVECRPEHLVQFAVMGSIYAEKFFGISNPRVGLLSNGEEEGKGNNLVKETFPLLKEESKINFVGNIEPKEAFAGDADVVVTDGFTGNIFLKATEAVGSMIIGVLKESMTSTLLSTLGAALVKPSLKPLKTLLDPNAIGAAPLLGVDGLAFIGHGRSDEYAVAGALRNAQRMVDSGILEAMQQAIASM
ncbi:MAG: phosphate acyltransferase PlsX [Anaerolineaceae bacterium]|nr:phosphate acyltransferase PlsX [Anaerolineaceae bacterium]